MAAQDQMTIQDWQSSVDHWIKTYGVRYFDIKTNNLLLVEEVGELTRLIARRYGEQSFKKEMTDAKVHEEIKDEIADVAFVLTCIANQLDIDLARVLQRNMEKKTNRDKERHQNNQRLF